MAAHASFHDLLHLSACSFMLRAPQGLEQGQAQKYLIAGKQWGGGQGPPCRPEAEVSQDKFGALPGMVTEQA